MEARIISGVLALYFAFHLGTSVGEVGRAEVVTMWDILQVGAMLVFIWALGFVSGKEVYGGT